MIYLYFRNKYFYQNTINVWMRIIWVHMPNKCFTGDWIIVELIFLMNKSNLINAMDNYYCLYSLQVTNRDLKTHVFASQSSPRVSLPHFIKFNGEKIRRRRLPTPDIRIRGTRETLPHRLLISERAEQKYRRYEIPALGPSSGKNARSPGSLHRTGLHSIGRVRNLMSGAKC